MVHCFASSFSKQFQPVFRRERRVLCVVKDGNSCWSLVGALADRDLGAIAALPLQRLCAPLKSSFHAAWELHVPKLFKAKE